MLKIDSREGTTFDNGRSCGKLGLSAQQLSAHCRVKRTRVFSQRYFMFLHLTVSALQWGVRAAGNLCYSFANESG
jgi:hypothetical protein